MQGLRSIPEQTSQNWRFRGTFRLGAPALQPQTRDDLPGLQTTCSALSFQASFILLSAG